MRMHSRWLPAAGGLPGCSLLSPAQVSWMDAQAAGQQGQPSPEMPHSVFAHYDILDQASQVTLRGHHLLAPEPSLPQQLQMSCSCGARAGQVGCSGACCLLPAGTPPAQEATRDAAPLQEGSRHGQAQYEALPLAEDDDLDVSPEGWTNVLGAWMDASGLNDSPRDTFRSGQLPAEPAVSAVHGSLPCLPWAACRPPAWRNWPLASAAAQLPAMCSSYFSDSSVQVRPPLSTQRPREAPHAPAQPAGSTLGATRSGSLRAAPPGGLRPAGSGSVAGLEPMSSLHSASSLGSRCLQPATGCSAQSLGAAL